MRWKKYRDPHLSKYLFKGFTFIVAILYGNIKKTYCQQKKDKLAITYYHESDAYRTIGDRFIQLETRTDPNGTEKLYQEGKEKLLTKYYSAQRPESTLYR